VETVTGNGDGYGNGNGYGNAPTVALYESEDNTLSLTYVLSVIHKE